jgi:hypothetical protein
LATATDENGEEIPVCIENQYGVSDGDHLGRLIAYLAQHERGRGVWIVEHAHDAFVAAVRFLNRTSTDDRLLPHTSALHPRCQWELPGAL